MTSHVCQLTSCIGVLREVFWSSEPGEWGKNDGCDDKPQTEDDVGVKHAARERVKILGDEENVDDNRSEQSDVNRRSNCVPAHKKTHKKKTDKLSQ